MFAIDLIANKEDLFLMISVTGKSDTIRSLKGYHSLHNIINHEIYFYKSFVFVLNVLPCFLILLDKYRISFRL